MLNEYSLTGVMELSANSLSTEMIEEKVQPDIDLLKRLSENAPRLIKEVMKRTGSDKIMLLFF